MIPCKCILGARGSGKSTGLLVDLLAAAMMGVAVVVFDRPGTLARSMVGHLCARGLESRTLIEIASDTERVLPFPYIQNSDKRGLEGERENEIQDEMLSQAFYAKKGMKSGEKNPWTKQVLDLSGAIFRGQPQCESLPIENIKNMFLLGTKEHDEFLEKSSEWKKVLELMSIEILGRREHAMQVGAAQRMLSVLWRSPVVRIRHGKGLDWTKALKQKKQICFDLSNITEEAARTITILGAHSAINASRRHFYETKEPLPVVIVLEECGALDLATPFIISSMQELRKAGVSIWVVSQTVNDFDPAVFEQLLGLCEEHIYYRMKSGIDRAADDCTHPSFDPNAIHYMSERIVSEGFDTIRTTLRGTSKDASGKKREDKRESISYVPKQHVVVDRHYKPYELQKQEWATKLCQQDTGYRTVVGLTGVRSEHVIELGEPWPLGLSEIRTRKAIERIRSKPPFREVHETTETRPERKAASLNG